MFHALTHPLNFAANIAERSLTAPTAQASHVFFAVAHLRYCNRLGRSHEGWGALRSLIVHMWLEVFASVMQVDPPYTNFFQVM